MSKREKLVVASYTKPAFALEGWAFISRKTSQSTKLEETGHSKSFELNLNGNGKFNWPSIETQTVIGSFDADYQ